MSDNGSIHTRRVTFAAIWQPVFGAYVALRVRDFETERPWYTPYPETMREIVKDAAESADDAVDAWEALGRR